jgi:hypothetical protein
LEACTDGGMRVRMLMPEVPRAMNTGRMTTSGLLPRGRWTQIAGYAVLGLLAVYGVLVLATEASALTALLVVVGVLVLDGLLLARAAKRRSLSVAIWCGAAALFAALVQAVWVYIPFGWDVLGPNSDDVAWFGSALVVALVLAAGLLVRRESRPFGWAVLMGSTQGFVASFVAIAAAFAAAMGAD